MTASRGCGLKKDLGNLPATSVLSTQGLPAVETSFPAVWGPHVQNPAPLPKSWAPEPPTPRRPHNHEKGGPRQKLRIPNTYDFARGPGGLHADAKLAVQVDYGVVDEGEDFQLKLGLVGVPVLNHTGVSVGDGAAGRRAKGAH